MIKFIPIEQPAKEIVLSVSTQSIILLRISIKSKFVAPAVIQPKVEDWIDEKGVLYPIHCKVQPQYLYLASGSTSSMNFSITVPAISTKKISFYTTILFSGFQNCSVRVKIAIDRVSNSPEIIEKIIQLDLPLFKSNSNKSIYPNNSEQVSRILSSLSGIEIIPAKWLILELIFILCEKGIHVADQKKTKTVITKLCTTKFFKNGVLIVSGSQIVHWITTNAGIHKGIRNVIGNQSNQTMILETWERWLLNLVENDIEDIAFENEVQLHNNKNFDEIISFIGNEPERWFLFFLLGLMEVSPRINDIIHQLCKKNLKKKVKGTPTKPKTTSNVLNELGSIQR